MDDVVTIYLRNVARQLALFSTEELEQHLAKCSASLDYAESVGCLLDPTGYLKALDSGNLEDARNQLAIVKHLVAARRAIDVRERLVAAKATGDNP